MKTSIRFSLLLSVLFAGSALSPSSAHVSYGSWADGRIEMNAYAPNFGTGTSLRAALESVEDTFFFEQPSNAWFAMSYDDTDVAPDNDENEFWFSGVTTGPPAECLAWVTTSGEIVEADVIFYANTAWTTDTTKQSTLAYGGAARLFQATAVHELGHAAGLSHETGTYNVMGQEWDHVTCNGSAIRAYLGEDAADGLVQLYGTFQMEDLSVSLFQHTGSFNGYSTHGACFLFDSNGSSLPSLFEDGQPRYQVPFGQPIQAEFTYDNNGANAKVVQLGFYVSTNSFISTADTLIHTETISISRDDPLTRMTTVNLPTDLNFGQTYYLGVIIDDGDQISEAVETNNEAYHLFEVSCETAPYVEPFSAAPNPDSMTSTQLNLGSVFVLTVDLTTSGHTLALPFGFDTPTDITLSGGQRLLCVDAGGSGEVLGFGAQSGTSPSWFGVVPNLTHLCGYAFSMQAIHYGGVVPFALSNALDVRIGP